MDRVNTRGYRWLPDALRARLPSGSLRTGAAVDVVTSRPDGVHVSDSLGERWLRPAGIKKCAVHGSSEMYSLGSQGGDSVANFYLQRQELLRKETACMLARSVRQGEAAHGRKDFPFCNLCVRGALPTLGLGARTA